MDGAKDLLNSERGWFSLAVMIVAGVLVIFGAITGQGWIDLMKWVGITLILSKTASTAIDQFNSAKSPRSTT